WFLCPLFPFVSSVRDHAPNGAPVMPVVGPRWDLTPCDETATATLAAALDIDPPVASLLCQRGLADPDTARRFLNPVLEHLHAPMRLADMGIAVDRIMAAIARRERI